MRRLLKWALRLVALAVVAAVGFFSWFVLWPAHGIPALEPVDEYVWLDQGWGSGQNASLRRVYYYTPQGTSVPQGASTGALRYSWFVNLELPFSTERFADPAHMRKLRFIVDPEPSPENPHQLPIGSLSSPPDSITSAWPPPSSSRSSERWSSAPKAAVRR